MQLSFNKGTVPVPCSASANPAARRLTDLREGETAVLDVIDLPTEMSHRLMELGFLPGLPITAARSAPGGDPRVFRVDGTEIALRSETASHILLLP